MYNVTLVPSDDQVIFYPIGNTPAVNLLSHHAPNPGKTIATEVLSLACGDPRSVLYSLWCEGRPGAEKFNFTCCDLEPAVLARNVLLLSLMLDNVESYAAAPANVQSPELASIWNLWYHFFISEKDLALVREQSTKLLSYTENQEKWAQSPYSSITFVSLQTVDEIRKIWTKYAVNRARQDQERYESSRREEIKALYDRTYGKGGTSATFYAGPHWEVGLETMNKGLRAYWATGIAGGNEPDITALGSDGKGLCNPLIMVCSFSEKFLVHFTIDPLTGYHLASVFDGGDDEDEDVKSMVALAKVQLQEWSKAFVDYAVSKSISVNLYYGDAVTFCHELAARTTPIRPSAVVTRLYTCQWSAKPLKLDGDGAKNLPMFFDIIDTSNLADWVGLPNILPPTAQILARKSTSVLYTETFRLTAEEPDDDLFESLFMDVDVASLFVGLAPMGHLVGYTTENNHGENMTHLENKNRYRIRVPWRVVIDHKSKSDMTCNSKDRRVQFDAEELSEIFFEIYLKMFAQENLDASIKEVKSNRPPMHSRYFSRYSRLSFATLIRHMLTNVVTDQAKFFALLLEKVGEDKTLHIGKDQVLDLMLQLLLCGAMEDAFPSPIKAANAQQYMFVTLVVPRKKLLVFERLRGAPGIHLGICKGKNNNYFFSIDCFFGKIEQNKDRSWGKVTEDPSGWAGSSDLIVTTPVPSQLLESGDWDCALLVTMSMHCAFYVETLGPELCIYMTPSNDKRHLFTSNSPPGIPQERFQSDLNRGLAALSLEQDSPVIISATQIKGPLMLQAKYTIEKDSEEAILLDKAAFVTIVDITPCSILLKIGDNHSRRIVFPYPIDGEKAKTRIARKSLWIEVNVPAASALVSGGYDSKPFPVIIEQDNQPLSWSLPRIDLSKQPAISPMDPDAWLADSFDQFVSVREKKLIDVGHPRTPDFRSFLPFFKKTLLQISMYVADEMKVFVLAGVNERADVFDTLIVANCLRHGRETSTLILDAWVVPVPLNERINFMLLMPRRPGKCTVYQLQEQETAIWKHILPAAVESCRRDWKHESSCEYLETGKIPLSTAPWKSPICSCGEGKDVEDFPSKSFVKKFKRSATRVAIPMLSAVSYVEAMDPRETCSF